MLRDLRTAIRTLAQAPTFTGSAVLALALAIGANGAMFGLVDALWFRPPGVRDAATIVRVYATTPEQADGAWSWAEFGDLAGRTTTLEQVAVRGRRGALLTQRDGSHELLLVNVVSTNFFELLGVRPLEGRLFSRSDGQPSDRPGVVLGHSFWQSFFGGDPAIVGRTLRLGRGGSVIVDVVGVLPPTFRDLEASADRDLWLTPAAWHRVSGSRVEEEARDQRWFEMVARRRAAMAPVRAELESIAAALAAEHPATSRGRSIRVVTDRDDRVARGGIAARALLGLVLLVVVITCVNVANLLLARSAARAQELAIRAAIGASRWRIARQLVAESVVLGVAGAAAGMIVAAWLIRLMPSLMTTPPGLRSFLVFQTDARVFAFTAVVTLMTTVLFGLAPALLGSRADVITVIKSSAGASVRGGTLKRALVAAQVAVSLVLLCVAGALAASYRETQRGDIGFSRASLLTLWTTSGSDDPVRGAEAVRQLRGLPGVRDVAVAIRAPLSLSGGGLARPVALPDGAISDPAPQVKFNAVSANYFDVMKTRLLQGRTFSDGEERGGEATVVVNEQFVRQFLDGAPPVGRVIRIAGADHRIVGVAQNGVVNTVGEAPQAYMYLPFWHGQHGEATFILSTDGDAASLGGAAKDVLRRLHPALEPRRVVTMSEYLDYATSLHRATAALSGILGLLGLLLTAVGVYGVVAYRTTRRVKEIGIRMALGAAPSQVLRLVVNDGMLLGVAGVLAGIPLALGATRWTASLLVGVDPWDAGAFAVAAATLLAAIAVATLLPARRATRVEPSTALRG